MNIAIIAAGQLEAMVAEVLVRLGHKVTCLETATLAMAHTVCEVVNVELLTPEKLQAFIDDEKSALHDVARECELLLYFWENAPEALIELFEKYGVRVLPSTAALYTTRDKLLEKELCAELGIPTAPFMAVDGFGSLAQALDILAPPIALKIRRNGYDGLGQVTITGDTKLRALREAWESLSKKGTVPLVAESKVSLRRELSVITGQSLCGERQCFPLFQNYHAPRLLEDPASGQLLRLTVWPAPDQAHFEQAREWANKLMDSFGYGAGVFTLECFETEDGELLVNEMAPRVHNSGHATRWPGSSEFASQFDFAARGVLDLPLGNIERKGVWAMVNAIGQEPQAVPRRAWVHYTSYNKSLRPGRKMGHAVIWAPDYGELRSRINEFRDASGLYVPNFEL